MGLMRVFRFMGGEHELMLRPAISDDFDLFQEFQVEPLARKWQPVEVRIVATLGAADPTDFPWLAAPAPVLTVRAAELLADELARHGELLPLSARDETYYALNV